MSGDKKQTSFPVTERERQRLNWEAAVARANLRLTPGQRKTVGRALAFHRPAWKRVMSNPTYWYALAAFAGGFLMGRLV